MPHPRGASLRRAGPLPRLVIEMLLLLVLAFMARKSPYRNTNWKRQFKRYLRGSMDESMLLGTLAAKDVISQAVGDTVKERTYLSSVVARWSITSFTKSTGDGPILVGVAHSDYSAAEIEEWLENSGSWDEGDLVQQEIAKRKIRQVGFFENPIDEADSVVLNYGKAINTKCGWILNTGQTVQIWAYNAGGSPLATTDPIVQAFGHGNLWPR